MYRDYLANEIPIFPLWSILPDGSCACKNPDCKAAGKHPRSSHWQSTPLWSDEQLDFMEESGQLDSGYGAVVSGGLLVIDVDARNGGVASFGALLDQFPSLSQAGLVVETGSGGGSRHFYFRQEGQPLALKQSLDQFPGIDFKSSGYVVGPGSRHASGGEYKITHGDPAAIQPPPNALLAILKKPDVYRATIDNKITDVSDDDILSMLSAIDADCSYDKWIRIGMAIHQATSGAGVDVWDKWSSTGDKYPGPRAVESHWHSFGKSTNPVTLGTLYHYAQAAGWVWPVTFAIDHESLGFQIEHETSALEDLADVDILRPPGFVGQLVDWINARSLYPREHLAVAAALTVISGAAGMRYRDKFDMITPNIFAFGVAASATGKESILKSTQQLLAAAGVAPAIHGGIKSEQEIFRNLLHHQAAIYLLDEMGEVLSKLSAARKSGSTPYLQGVIGQLMAIYSKADSYLPVTGDLKRQIENELHSARKSIVDEHGESPTDRNMASALERVNRNLNCVHLGIPDPYLLLFGLTTPGTFDEIMTFDMAVNGFLGRCVIFREMDDNPRAKDRDKFTPPGEVPDALAGSLRALYAPGHSDMPKTVARHGDIVAIETTEDAARMLVAVLDSFWQQAQLHSEATGLTPIPRRGYELVAKISLLLAIPGGVRTVEHVRWAYALVKRDIDGKLKLAHANSAPDESDALQAKILSAIDPDNGETLGRIRNKCRKWKKEIVDKALTHLEVMDLVKAIEQPASRAGGRITKKYFVVN